MVLPMMPPRPPMGMAPGPRGLPPELMALLAGMGGPPRPPGMPGMGPMGPGMPPGMPPRPQGIPGLPGMPPPLPPMGMAQGGPLPPGMMPPPMPGMPGPQGMPPNPQGQMGNMLTDPAFWAQLSEFMDTQEDEGEQAQPERQNKNTKKRKIDENIVRQRIDRVVPFWQLRDTRMDDDEVYYNLESDVEGDGELIVSNMPFTVVEKVSNLLGAQRPSIEVLAPANDLRDTAQKASDALTWAWGQWDDVWRESGIQGSMFRSMAFFLALRGMVAARINYLPDAEERELPISVKLFDPRQVYPMMGDRGLRYVVLKQRYTIGQVIEEYEEAEALFEGREDTEDIELEAYYDDWFHAVYADSKLLKAPEAHEYGFVPWVISPGYGSPIRATDNDAQGWVERASYSIFHGSRALYDQFNAVLSQIATDVARSADPPLVYKYDPANPDEPQKIRLQPGAVNYLIYDKESVEPISLSTKPSDVAPLMDKLSSDIARGTLPDILWGGGIGQSGITSSILTDSAKDALFPLLEGMKWTIRRINSLALRLIRDLHDEPVGFYVKDRSTGQWEGGVTIAPGEIEEIGLENVVEYRDVAPKDRMAMASMAQMLVKEKLVSMETARREYLGLENPERENDLVLTDLIYMDENAVKNVFTPLALFRSDPEHFLLWQLSKQHELMTQGGGGGGGAPMGPGGRPPGPPMGPPGGPGLPPGVMPPIMQPGADPMAQSIGSMLGGMGMTRPPGLPGAGAPPVRFPLG